MNPYKLAWQETLPVLIGTAICTGLMIGVFALLGRYSTAVVLGGLMGALVAAANFFLMALGTGLAADKAQQQDVAGGQALIQLSYIGRMVGLFLVLFLLAKTGLFDVVALVIPLVFVRPALTVAEIFKKKGEKQP